MSSTLPEIINNSLLKGNVTRCTTRTQPPISSRLTRTPIREREEPPMHDIA